MYNLSLYTSQVIKILLNFNARTFFQKLILLPNIANLQEINFKFECSISIFYFNINSFFFNDKIQFLFSLILQVGTYFKTQRPWMKISFMFNYFFEWIIINFYKCSLQKLLLPIKSFILELLSKENDSISIHYHADAMQGKSI